MATVVSVQLTREGIRADEEAQLESSKAESLRLGTSLAGVGSSQRELVQTPQTGLILCDREN